MPSLYIRLGIPLCSEISLSIMPSGFITPMPLTSPASRLWIFTITQSLTRVVNFSTHFPSDSNGHASWLDLILTSSPHSCHVLQRCRLGKSDNALMSVDISFCSSIRYEQAIFMLPMQWQGHISRVSSRRLVELNF